MTVDGKDWWTGPVTVGWTARDGESGLAGPPPADTTASADGAGSADSDRVCDVADNCASGSFPVRIDRHGPVVVIGGVTNGSAYELSDVPTPTCTATDAQTGVPGGCSVTVTGGNANHVGAYRVTATARDGAGNSTTATATYRVPYLWQGFSQPIDDPAHQASATTSVFKAGSTVPVKFGLADASGAVITPTTAPVWVTRAKGSSTTLPVDESVYTDAPDSGTLYRWATDHW